MGQKHTKEPWTAIMHDMWGKRLTVICDNNTAFFQDEEDAIRAAACGRACAGIPTEALEDGVMKEVLQFVSDVARAEGCPGGCRPCAGQCDSLEWKAIERDELKEEANSILAKLNTKA